jgi:hypothetical protein
MSQYLRLIQNLLVTLGGTASPEPFSLKEAEEKEQSTVTPSKAEIKKGKIIFSPTSFTFFQGMMSRSYIIGHIPQDDGHSFPLVLAINASSIVLREVGSLKPYIQPVIRETVLLPEKLPFGEDDVKKHIEYGLDIERYNISDKTYKGICASAAQKALDLLAGVKETIFLTFAKALGDDSFMVLVDGSLRPSKDVVAHSNWVGLYLNPPLNAAEETASLELSENEIGPPFKLTGNGKAFFWHLRLLSDFRKGPEWGIVRIDNSLSDGEDMPSKIESISAAILAERYPIHPAAITEGWGLYPLITARGYLNTQTTSETTIMKYF